MMARMWKHGQTIPTMRMPSTAVGNEKPDERSDRRWLSGRDIEPVEPQASWDPVVENVVLVRP